MRPSPVPVPPLIASDPILPRHHRDLEQAVEDLSGMLEEPIDTETIAELRQKVTDKTVRSIQPFDRTGPCGRLTSIVSPLTGLRPRSPRDHAERDGTRLHRWTSPMEAGECATLQAACVSRPAY